jgi:carbonic anhydrase
MRVPQQLVEGLRRFRRESFPLFREHYQRLVAEGQRPSTLFLGCADSRVVPDLLTSALPGDLFVIRNVGSLIPPFEPDAGFHGTSAGIEFATLVLGVKDIVVCGHSHCGAIRALFTAPREDAPHIARWLELARPALVDAEPTEPNLRRTEMRAVVLQVERLMSYPMVRERVESGELCLHGWYYVIEEGQVLGLDPDSGEFRPLS